MTRSDLLLKGSKKKMVTGREMTRSELLLMPTGGLGSERRC